MATRLPLVIVNGQMQQLQSGDSIVTASAQYSSDTFTNAESSAALVIGTPIYMSAANAAKRAEANAAATSGVVGVWLDASTAASDPGQCVLSGRLVATTTQWDAVADTTGGLVADTVYYLDPATPGKLTSTAPTTVGQLVVKIGRAVSTTDLEIDIEMPILL